MKNTVTLLFLFIYIQVCVFFFTSSGFTFPEQQLWFCACKTSKIGFICMSMKQIMWEMLFLMSCMIYNVDLNTCSCFFSELKLFAWSLTSSRPSDRVSLWWTQLSAEKIPVHVDPMKNKKMYCEWYFFPLCFISLFKDIHKDPPWIAFKGPSSCYS